jgi:hypothetical protein
MTAAIDLTQAEFDLLQEIASKTTFDPNTSDESDARKEYGEAVVAESLATLFEAGLIARTAEGYRATSLGQTVLVERIGEFVVDKDNDSGRPVQSEPHGPPRKPFDATLIRMERAGFSVFETVRRIGSKRIKLNPDFQRAFVWDKKRQSQLVESLLMRIPLPAIYVDASREDSWEVIDGLQRLSTLRDFMNPSNGFALSDLGFLKELNGKRFAELPSAYRTIVEDSQLTFFCLQPGVEPSAKYIIFSRLNTGGLALVAQEIRHALFQGPVTKALRELALHTDFLVATQRGFKPSRMQDQEVVLRALAFGRLVHVDGSLAAYLEYDDLDDFLNRSMDWFNQPEHDNELKRLSSGFLQAMRTARAIFGRYAFRKFYSPTGRRGALNKALFEAWTVAFMFADEQALVLRRRELMSAFAQSLTEDLDFERSVTSSTGTFSAIVQRFHTVQDLLEEALR